MTRNQKAVIDFIKSYTAEHGIAPSYTEIANAIPSLTRGGAHRVVMALVGYGQLTFDPGRHRSIEVVDPTAQQPSLSSYNTAALISEIERRGFKVGHIYRDAYGAREFCALGSSERITVASDANSPTYRPEN